MNIRDTKEYKDILNNVQQYIQNKPVGHEFYLQDALPYNLKTHLGVPFCEDVMAGKIPNVERVKKDERAEKYKIV